MKNNKLFSILIITTIILLMILFESFQQQFYIQKFQPEYPTKFWELFYHQAIKWSVWLILSYFLYFHIKKLALKNQILLIDLFKLFIIILALIFFDILIISSVTYIINSDIDSFFSYLEESMIFYAYQKTPIYTLGYIGFSAIVYFYFKTQQLMVEISELGELKQENNALYTKLATHHQDKSSVLKIKMGNKYKIIPVDDIYWLQADDYCVNVHTNQPVAYSLRMSLKALEKKMPQNFLRVHRAAMVNMDKLTEFQPNGSTKITLNNSVTVAVSKSKIKSVNDYLIRHT